MRREYRLHSPFFCCYFQEDLHPETNQKMSTQMPDDMVENQQQQEYPSEEEENTSSGGEDSAGQVCDVNPPGDDGDNDGDGS